MINPLLYKSVPYDLEKDFIPLVDMAGSPDGIRSKSEERHQDRRGVCCVRERQKGRGQLRQRGLCHAVASRRRVFQEPRRHRNDARPLQRRRTANQALLGGQVDMVSGALPGAHPHIVAGTLTGIAVTGEKRWFDLPNVPTMVEAGYPGFVLDTYTLMLVPTKTPAEIVERLSSAVRTILQKPDVRDKLRAVGLEVTAGGPDELKARFARELPLWRDVVKIAGISPPINCRQLTRAIGGHLRLSQVDRAAWDRFRMNPALAPITIVPVGEPTTPVVASSVDPDEKRRGTPRHQARR